MIICFLAGVVFAIQYYIPHELSEEMLTEVNNWFIVIGIFGAILGLYSILHMHLGKIKHRSGGWGFSVVLIITLIFTLITGIIGQGNIIDPKTSVITPLGWVYMNMLAPLQGTVFAILAFFIASVAFRTFRAKTFEATLLLVAAIIVMFGRVPLGEYLWSKLTILIHENIPSISNITSWIMSTLNMAARRGILLGVTLGAIATSLKIIFGIERAYLGGKE